VADFRPDVERILRKVGCYFKRRGKGDHDIWYSPISNRPFTVARGDRITVTVHSIDAPQPGT
jgi:hypothetical protein